MTLNLELARKSLAAREPYPRLIFDDIREDVLKYLDEQPKTIKAERISVRRLPDIKGYGGVVATSRRSYWYAMTGKGFRMRKARDPDRAALAMQDQFDAEQRASKKVRQHEAASDARGIFLDASILKAAKPYGHTAYTRHTKTGKTVNVGAKGVKAPIMSPGAPPQRPQGWSVLETKPVERKMVRKDDGTKREVPGAPPGSHLPKQIVARLKQLGVTKFPAAHIGDVKVHSRIHDDEHAHTGALLSWKDDKGRGQSSYSQEFDRKNAEKKWERVTKHRGKIESVVENLSKKAPNSPAHAAALLIAQTGLRPGSTKSAEEEGHYGVTTLQVRHVSELKDGSYSLNFIGKSGKKNKARINDPVLTRAIRKFIKGKAPSDDVFDASRAAVAQALPKGIKLKDLRTLVATNYAEQLLDLNPPKRTGNDEKDAKYVCKLLKEVSAEVADRLNNTAAVARRSYIAPAVIQAWGKAHRLPEEWFK